MESVEDAKSKPEILSYLGTDMLNRVLSFLQLQQVLVLRQTGRWFNVILDIIYYGNLQDLKVKYEALKDAKLSDILKNCHSVHRLQLFRAKDIGLSGVEVIVALRPNLSSLRLSGCTLIDDECVQKLVQGLPLLSHLYLNCCEKISDVAVKAIADHKPYLEALSVAMCYRVTSESVALVTRGCSKLTDLDLRALNLSDGGLESIFSKPVEVIDLDLGLCTQLTDLGLGPTIRNCPKLEKLSVKGTKVGDESLQALGESCPDLKELNLMCCENVTTTGVDRVAERWPNLTHLHLAMSSIIEDNAIRSLALHCPNLQFLNVRNCSKLTDAALCSLADGCPRLTFLDVSGCASITDIGINAIRCGCLGLDKRLLSFVCPRVTQTA